MRRLFNRPLKSTIMWLFIPLIVVFVPATGAVSYILASDQLKLNAERSINDTLSQTRNFMNDRLTAVLLDLTALDNNGEMRSLFYRADQKSFAMRPQDYATVSRNMNKVYSDFYTLIDSLLVYYYNGRISLYRRDYLHADYAFDKSVFLRYPYENASQVYWLNLHGNELDARSGAKVASVYKWVGGPDGERTGLLLLQLKEEFFRSLLTAPSISPNGYMLLASPDGVASFKNARSEYDLDEEMLRRQLVSPSAGSSGKMELQSRGGRDMVVLYDTIGINKWKLAAVYPQSEIYEKINYIQVVSLSAMAAVVTVVVLLSGLLANVVARPLSRLTRQINDIEKGHLEMTVYDPPDNEVGILSKGIKDMLERIKQLLAQVEYEQEQKRISELSALQAQIQPHFLYNTLYSIKQLCEMGDTREASRMITALSSYFRISISKGNEMIPVETELEHIRQYLMIQHMRYGESISYEIDVPADMLSCLIVKLTLQPLVENAIYHGVKKVRRPGNIRISGEIKGGICRIRVDDNGPGMEPERLAQLRRSLAANDAGGQPPVGYGVRNVHRRLQLHFGAAYGLHYESKPDAGTTVTVAFPFNRPEAF